MKFLCLYIYRQRNFIHHQRFQTHRPQECPPHQEHHRKSTHPPKPPSDIYSQSEAYKLSCSECNKGYVGQTVRRFSMRYREHRAAFRNNNHTYSFTKHLHEEGHSFGPMNEIMRVLHCNKKGPHLNTVERFHIHAESITNNHLNDEQTIFPNTIFDVLLKTRRP